MKRLTALLLLFCLLLPCACCAEDDDDLLIEEVIESVPEKRAESIYDANGVAQITVTCTGDFTIGQSYGRKKINFFTDLLKKHNDDINFTMKNTRELFLSDQLTLVNFEGTLTETKNIPSNKKENDFLFKMAPRYVNVLTDNGIEAVSLENNHVMDFGEEGYEDTMNTLQEAGVVYSNSTHMGVYDVEGIQIAMMSYLCIDRYDKPVDGYSNLYEKVEADIKAIKEKYPVLIVSFHWGRELDYSPTSNQIKMGHLAVDAGADLVIGHHSHRINPIEQYNGVYICYSLGNFCFSGNGKPSDMSSYIFQTRFRIKDGNILSRDFRIVPISISSREDTNDCIPTIEKASTKTDSILTVLRSNGKKLEYAVQQYPMEWR
ncbi:MAG: CapA family protein [Clostridia bacterium]|jgi:poly-gamma-glutamate synthesis protein (capsule biosynthesis protein)|nr:CapA family protein [Clostridia bacterium]